MYRVTKDTFQGGPFDGYPVTRDDAEFIVHTFSCGDRIAVYELDDDDTAFVFRGIRDRDETDDDECEVEMQETCSEEPPWRG